MKRRWQVIAELGFHQLWCHSAMTPNNIYYIAPCAPVTPTTGLTVAGCGIVSPQLRRPFTAHALSLRYHILTHAETCCAEESECLALLKSDLGFTPTSQEPRFGGFNGSRELATSHYTPEKDV